MLFLVAPKGLHLARNCRSLCRHCQNQLVKSFLLLFIFELANIYTQQWLWKILSSCLFFEFDFGFGRYSIFLGCVVWLWSCHSSLRCHWTLLIAVILISLEADSWNSPYLWSTISKLGRCFIILLAKSEAYQHLFFWLSFILGHQQAFVRSSYLTLENHQKQLLTLHRSFQ